VDALLNEVLRMRGCLHNRDAGACRADCVGDVNERRPREEQLFRLASGRIIEEADLGYV
jgi:hypothetical protein